MRIIVTGFEPFGGRTVNASWEAVEQLQRVRRVLLPVSFARSCGRIREIAREGADAVLCVGEAGGRSEISVEQMAVNRMDARIPDNDGMQPRNEPVLVGGAAVRLSTLPAQEIVSALRSAGIPAGLSQSAGTYVCNAVFYALMETLEAQPGRLGGFVHVPAEGMPLAERVRALEIALDCIRGCKITGG